MSFVWECNSVSYFGYSVQNKGFQTVRRGEYLDVTNM